MRFGRVVAARSGIAKVPDGADVAGPIGTSIGSQRSQALERSKMIFDAWCRECLFLTLAERFLAP
jgi:hypothetical protein